MHTAARVQLRIELVDQGAQETVNRFLDFTGVVGNAPVTSISPSEFSLFEDQLQDLWDVARKIPTLLAKMANEGENAIQVRRNEALTRELAHGDKSELQ